MFSPKISPRLPGPQKSQAKKERGGHIFPEFFFPFFFLIERVCVGGAATAQHSTELNAFFKVELNFVQNPPGGHHY